MWEGREEEWEEGREAGGGWEEGSEDAKLAVTTKYRSEDTTISDSEATTIHHFGASPIGPGIPQYKTQHDSILAI